MFKTIGLFAHVDAGKTTFAESLMYVTNSLKKRGRVDHKDTLLDHHAIERARGITVFSDVATFNYKDSTYYLVDTPGHVDFSYEMEKAIGMMDAAIIIVSAVDGVQSHTKTVWQLLRKENVPTIIFINKMDRDIANLHKVMKQLKTELSPNCYLLEEENESWIEQLAELDETLMETYFEDGYQETLWQDVSKSLFLTGNTFPTFKGSALQDSGVHYFMSQLDELLTTNYDQNEPFSGRVFQIRFNEIGEQVSYIKAHSGTLKVRDMIFYGEGEFSDKVNQIRIYSGPKYEQVNHAVAGQIFGVTGLTNVLVGDGVGTLKQTYHPTIIPTLQVQVLYPANIHPKDMLKLLRQLEVENPMLGVSFDEENQSIQIAVMGVIQLEVLKELVATRYDVAIDFGPCEIIYLESIKEAVIGRGHYEPLKHYAEVHLRLEPAPRGSGITVSSDMHVDKLPISYQNLIQSYVLSQRHKGALTGSLLSDVHITLVAGAAHELHTSGGDFLEATRRAIRQGVFKAESVLLEPYYEFEIEVGLNLLGRVLHDIQLAHGQFLPPLTSLDKAVIKGVVPVVNFMNYGVELLSFSQGEGRLSLQVKGYDVCHNPTDVIKKYNYDKDSDRLNPAASIFCAKGSGFVVPWDESDKYMHC